MSEHAEACLDLTAVVALLEEILAHGWGRIEIIIGAHDITTVHATKTYQRKVAKQPGNGQAQHALIARR